MGVPNSIITGSVGASGANKRTDVLLIQLCLNAVPQASGGPLPALAPDPNCGQPTITAIHTFQTRNFCFPDGRIDPGMTTEKKLIAKLSALGVLEKVLAAAKAGVTPLTPPAAPPPPPAPVATGDNSPIRRRFKAICDQLLPPFPGLTAGGGGGASGSGCGEFPGRVFLRVPVLLPHQPGAFKMNLPGLGVTYLTSPTPAWEQFAQEIDLKLQPARKTWVPFSPGKSPKPGDIYVLGKFDNPAAFRHVGIVIKADPTEWLTADGGQGQTGWQSGFSKRAYQSSGLIVGGKEGQAMVRGWVDLDAIMAAAISAFPSNL